MDTHEALEKVLAEFASKPKPGEPGWEEWVEEMRSDIAKFEHSVPYIMSNKYAILTRRDVEVLDGSINRRVRMQDFEDSQVKKLYKIWKSL